MATHSIDDLKTPSAKRNIAFDRLVQRVGSFLMGALLIAALLGYLGRGPLTRRVTVADDHSLKVTYYSIERYESPTELRLQLNEVRGGEPLEVRISREFADSTTIEQVSPPPQTSRLVGEDVVYVFAVEEVQETEVIFRFKHDDFGTLGYSVALDGHAAVPVRQFVLP